MSKEPRPLRVCILAPKPPPVHGSALMTQYLMECVPSNSVVWTHINAVFVEKIDQLAALTVKKIFKLAKYACQLVGSVISGHAKVVILTPACYFGPFLKDSLFIWLSRFVLRRRTIGWFHMDWRNMAYESRPALIRWYIRVTLRQLDRIVLLGERLRDFYPSFLDQTKIDIIPNGIPDPVEQAGFDREKSNASFPVLCLSNIAEAKGWREFIAAARILSSDFPKVEFVLRGAAHDQSLEALQTELSQNDAGGRIRYLGAVHGSEKWHTLANAKILCFTSHHEAFPLVILEAMGAGLPIVSTDVGAVAEALDDGMGGFVVPPKTAEALAEKLRILLENPDLRTQFADHNRNRFLRDYTLSAFGQRWAEFLKKCST